MTLQYYMLIWLILMVGMCTANHEKSERIVSTSLVRTSSGTRYRDRAKPDEVADPRSWRKPESNRRRVSPGLKLETNRLTLTVDDRNGIRHGHHRAEPERLSLSADDVMRSRYDKVKSDKSRFSWSIDDISRQNRQRDNSQRNRLSLSKGDLKNREKHIPTQIKNGNTKIVKNPKYGRESIRKQFSFARYHDPLVKSDSSHHTHSHLQKTSVTHDSERRRDIIRTKSPMNSVRHTVETKPRLNMLVMSHDILQENSKHAHKSDAGHGIKAQHPPVVFERNNPSARVNTFNPFASSLQHLKSANISNNPVVTKLLELLITGNLAPSGDSTLLGGGRASSFLKPIASRLRELLITGTSDTVGTNKDGKEKYFEQELQPSITKSEPNLIITGGETFHRPVPVIPVMQHAINTLSGPKDLISRGKPFISPHPVDTPFVMGAGFQAKPGAKNMDRVDSLRPAPRNNINIFPKTNQIDTIVPALIDSISPGIPQLNKVTKSSPKMSGVNNIQLPFISGSGSVPDSRNMVVAKNAHNVHVVLPKIPATISVPTEDFLLDGGPIGPKIDDIIRSSDVVDMNDALSGDNILEGGQSTVPTEINSNLMSIMTNIHRNMNNRPNFPFMNPINNALTNDLRNFLFPRPVNQLNTPQQLNALNGLATGQESQIALTTPIRRSPNGGINVNNFNQPFFNANFQRFGSNLPVQFPSQFNTIAGNPFLNQNNGFRLGGTTGQFGNNVFGTNPQAILNALRGRQPGFPGGQNQANQPQFGSVGVLG